MHTAIVSLNSNVSVLMDLEDLVSLFPLALKIFQLPPSQGSLSSKGEVTVRDIPLGTECSVVSHRTSCESLYLFLLSSGGSFSNDV